MDVDLEWYFNNVLDGASADVTKPLELVGSRMALVLEVQLGAKFFTSQVVTTNNYHHQ